MEKINSVFLVHVCVHCLCSLEGNYIIKFRIGLKWHNNNSLPNLWILSTKSGGTSAEHGFWLAQEKGFHIIYASAIQDSKAKKKHVWSIFFWQLGHVIYHIDVYARLSNDPWGLLHWSPIGDRTRAATAALHWWRKRSRPRSSLGDAMAMRYVQLGDLNIFKAPRIGTKLADVHQGCSSRKMIGVVPSPYLEQTRRSQKTYETYMCICS